MTNTNYVPQLFSAKPKRLHYPLRISEGTRSMRPALSIEQLPSIRPISFSHHSSRFRCPYNSTCLFFLEMRRSGVFVLFGSGPILR